MKNALKHILTIILILNISNSFAQSQIREKKIVINNDTLSYYDKGKGKTTLLFIHGSFVNKEYWKNQIQFFSKKYRVIALDFAGHGNSTHNRNNWTIQEFGNDITQIITKLSLKRVILIGHSVGADIALETASQNNPAIIGIVGIDYFKNTGFALPENVIEQVITNLKTDFRKTNEQYVNQALVTQKTNQGIKDRILSDFKSMNPNIGIAMNESFLHYSKRETDLLKKNRYKLYLLNADYSPTNTNSLKNIVGDNYELNLMNGTSHYSMIENPEKFNSELQKIIRQITR